MRALILAVALTSCAPSSEHPPEGKSGECASCHLPEYKSAADHVGKRPMTCHVCHGQVAWQPTFVDHRWPLTGKHRKLDCLKCHRDTPPVFETTPRTCLPCHRHDYEQAPDHADRATTCVDCHTTRGWKPAREIPQPIIDTPPIVPVPSVSVSASVSASVSNTPPKLPPKLPPKKPPKTPPPTPPDIISHPSGH